ncbi:MAG: MBL fold metallo-hydrolase, partial [Acidimicrobiia bacterium]
YHLTAFEAGETAAIAGVFDLALTHMSASLDPRISIDEASGAFVGPIIHAAPGTSFTVRTTE